MYGDELTMVYDTYSISKTGMDATGQKFPLTFKMGAGRPAGYIYFSVPFVYLFGPTVWGVRALSLISGLGIILLMYFLGKKLFGEKVGIIASFLAAISPWDIYLSRGGFEAHFALFLALLGITAFLYKKYIGWAIAWGIAVLTYPTFKLTLPLLFLILLWFSGFRKLVKDKVFIIGLIVLLFFGGIVAKETLTAGSEQRFLSLNIFADERVTQNLIQRVSYERNISTLPEFIKPIFINREIEYSRILMEDYIENISPHFLFLRGDGNPRHNPGEMGMLFLVDLPLIIAGLIFLWREKKNEAVFLTIWILITPLATMLMSQTHGLRNNLMLPPLLVIISFALSKIPKKYAYPAVSIMIFQLAYILIRVYTIAPAKFASFWSAEAKRIAITAIQSQKEGDKVLLNVNKIDNIEYAYEVYAKLDPELVISQFGKLPKTYGNVTITDK
jgi:4-amino-4-deoxy-L-arabinose transferase-like glycosyltransferase